MRIAKIIKLKQSLKYLYHNFVPEIFKVRLSTYLDPLPKHRLRASITIRTENYYQACIKELKNKKKNSLKNNHYLHDAFKKHLVRSNLIDEQWWTDFINLLELPNGPKFHKNNQSLIKRIENSNFNSLEYFEVLDIYALSLRHCLFELGYHLRKKSLEIAIKYSTSLKKNERWKFKAKLSALLETSNLSKFDEIFPIFKDDDNQEKYLLSYLRNVFSGKNYPQFLSPVSKIDSKKNQEFKKFVENKKIVVVGPSPTDNKDGYEIDKADVVIRTNYIKGDPIFKGSRVDISYFNLETTEHIIENGFSKWSKGISWIVARTSGQVESIFKRLSSDEIKIEHLSGRSLERVDKALFYGSLTAVQNIILDLLRYNPKEIFLYHFDIMLTKERINDYYPKIDKENEFHLKMIKSFPGHDPVINFKIMKSFWKKGFIKGDKRFEEVMKLDTKDYMLNMQKKYYLGNFVV